jgi:hypothetical protein
MAGANVDIEADLASAEAAQQMEILEALSIR